MRVQGITLAMLISLTSFSFSLASSATRTFSLVTVSLSTWDRDAEYPRISSHLSPLLQLGQVAVKVPRGGPGSRQDQVIYHNHDCGENQDQDKDNDQCQD